MLGKQYDGEDATEHEYTYVNVVGTVLEWIHRFSYL